MEPSKELIDQLYIEKVMRARSMSPEDKLLAPAHLFDYACSITIAGIRNQHPDASEEQVREMLRQRLKLARQMEAWS